MHSPTTPPSSSLSESPTSIMAPLPASQIGLYTSRTLKKKHSTACGEHGGCADCAIEDMLRSIIVVQGHQVITMQDWLAANSKPESAMCTHSHRKLFSTPNLRVAPAVEAPSCRQPHGRRQRAFLPPAVS